MRTGRRAPAWLLRVPHQTVYAVLRRTGLYHLATLHRVTRQVVRYARASAGELLHLDVKKLSRIPDGGGKRFAPAFAETRGGPHSRRSRGVRYLHVAVDDHSHYAYVEALPDESGLSAVAFLATGVSHHIIEAKPGWPHHRPPLTSDSRTSEKSTQSEAVRFMGIVSWDMGVL